MTYVPTHLKLADVKANARQAVENGTLQATRAQTNDTFEGACYNVHPHDPKVKCVIGHSLDLPKMQEQYALMQEDTGNPPRTAGIYRLVDLELVTCENGILDQLVELQGVHDAASRGDTNSSRMYRKLLKMLAE